MVTGDGKGLAGRQADKSRGGSGDGRTTVRRTTNRFQGGDDGGRTQGEDRREQEQEEPGGTLTTAMKATHGGADRGRSHGGGRDDISRGPTNGGGAGGRGARGGDGEPMSQGNGPRRIPGIRGWRQRQGILQPRHQWRMADLW